MRRSTRRVRAPPSAANRAARLPAGPAPTTTTSKVSTTSRPDEEEVRGGGLEAAENELGVDAERDDREDRDRDRGRPPEADRVVDSGGFRGRFRKRVEVDRLQNPGVVEHREGAVEEPGDGEPDEPPLRLDRGREQDELRDEPDRQRDPGEAQQH